MAGVKIGDVVVAVDSAGVAHDALVTIPFGPAPDEGAEDTRTVNVVFVSADETKTDSYGRQTERMTSCPHQSNTTAPGYYWKAK